MNITLLFVLMLNGFYCSGQGALSTLQTRSIKNLQTGQVRNFVCEFKIYPDDRVEWIQGSFVQSFPITSTEGAFPNGQGGSITYNLLKEGQSGKMVVERVNQNDLLLTLDLTKDNKVGAYYSFEISIQ